MSIKLGVVAPAEPFRTKPAPEAIWSREWPVLLFQVELAMAALPNCSFFCAPESFEPASKAKSKRSPGWGDVALIVILNCELPLEGQLPVPALAILTVPGVEEPDTIQLAPLYWTVMSCDAALVSEVAFTVKLEFDSDPCIT